MATATNSSFKARLLSQACLMFGLASPLAFAQEADTGLDDGHKYHHLDAVSVTASGERVQDVVQPTKILSEADLKQASGSTLGELLEDMPGVSNSSFGPGVGRPMIRGLSGNRVKIAVNGNDVADLSAKSSDHAAMAEMANAQQVEVIYGPGTLLYGSGAIGGVVNVSDERFHETPLLNQDGSSATQAEVSSSLSTVDEGTAFSAKLNQGFGENFVLHLDGFARQSEDFESPDSSLTGGSVQNTATQSFGFNTGLTGFTENGRVGVAVSYLDYEYGVPNEDNEDASVTPKQLRVDALHEASLLGSSVFGSALESIKTQFSFIDYEHNELEGSSVNGYFEKDSLELKSILSLNNLGSAWNHESQIGFHVNLQDVAICHDDTGGCDAIPNYSYLSWDGTQGGNFETRTDANGNVIEFAHDTPMPLTQTLDTALFALIRRDWLQGKQEYAVRVDHRTIESDPVSIRPASRRDASNYEDRTFTSLTASAGWTWLTNSGPFGADGEQKWGLSLAHTERAPQADELLWLGDHHATFSFQLDNPDLEKEIAHTLDVTWQYFAGDMQWDVAVYYYDFDGYIYNQIQSLVDPYHGDMVFRHVQRDAYLTGYEVSFQYDLSSEWAVSVVTDAAIGQLKKPDVNNQSKNLPRIPPQTLLAGVAWQKGHWLVKSNLKYFAKQSDVADYETTTDAYHTLNAVAAYEFELSDFHVDLNVKAKNLTDELGRNHVSYLKAYSPQPGRNFTFGLTVSY